MKPSNRLFPVKDRETVFLSVEEALNAICSDLGRYEPQILVSCQAMQLASGGGRVFKREKGRSGAWVGMKGRLRMKWMDGPELAEAACSAVREMERDPRVAAAICARVFHERAWAERNTETGEMGIRIETGMENFSCRQCGHCCMSLDYHDGLADEDVALWEKLGRWDILQWVRPVEEKGSKKAYRIWTIPGTARLADVCPFLKKVSSKNLWECLIHDVKPAICRQYPLTRKHGRMTGCPGFDAKKQD